ncbi:hypothetical protein PIROE2DRAFT_59916 [Piromyces sp. E2]|nr:hypothetical protein PIROE2DRAFT_59916 [Piromyces sp. E2]|eukprot:OUM65547.1 hypothetical protein PIROE2DRAFT_59916 [Piromyces sp. E2]
MGSIGPLDSYLKFSHNWKSDMEDSNMSDSFIQNINEYKKIFDVSVLNSENETQYYTSSNSMDLLNKEPKSSRKGIYHSSKRNNKDQWNKNISRAINKINQIIINNDDTSSTNNNSNIFLDSNPLKRQSEDSFDFKDPYMDNKGLFPSNGIEINTTENKREGRKSKHEKSPYDSKKKGKKDKESKSKESKRKSKKSKESKKKEEMKTSNNHISEDKKESTESVGGKRKKKSKDEILENLKSINTSEIKYDADVSLNSSLNSSESSINKIIQKSLSEYSRDITDLINKDKENKLRREMDSKSQTKQEHSSTKPLMLNNLNSTLKEIINQNISNNNNNSIISDTNNSELNSKILYIDNLIKEFDEDKKQSNNSVPLMNNKSRDAPTLEKDKNSDGGSGGEEVSIEIKCPFYSNGCTWSNKQSKLSDHLLYECTFCPNIITNTFSVDKKPPQSLDDEKKKHIEELSQKLNKLTLSLNNNGNKAILKKKPKNSEFDKDVLSLIFNNYLNEENEPKPEKERSIREKQDGVFDQIIQDYNYNSEESFLFKENNRHDKGSGKLVLNTNVNNAKGDEPISTADINFNDEPLTWDINSETDNQAPWIISPTSGKIKERKKYKLSDTNNEVRIKNKKSPVSEFYKGKKLLKKYDNLISYYDDDDFNMSSNEQLDSNDRKRNTPPSQSSDKPFNPALTFKFKLPNITTTNENPVPTLEYEPASPDPRLAKDLNDITLCINTQLSNNNEDMATMFTPQEIEVLMDVWFQNENDLGSECSLIFSRSETSFIKDLLSNLDEKTRNNLIEYNRLKLRESCQNINLLGSIENLLSLRQNEVKVKEVKEEEKKSTTPSIQQINKEGSNFTFDFNLERWNNKGGKEEIPQITRELNQAFAIPSEHTMNPVHDNNQKYKTTHEQRPRSRKPRSKKTNISNYISKALSMYDTKGTLLTKWTPEKDNQMEEKLLIKKKKFNRNQAQYYRINQHNSRHNKDKHTLYTNFLDYQTDRGFKSLGIQNNIRKKIKMMQIIKDIKRVKTTSVVSTNNKNKKRKVETEKKQKSLMASYFNNTLNLVMKTLMNNSKTKPLITEGATIKKQMNIFGAEANIDFSKHTLIIYNKKTSELNYVPKNKEKVVKKAVRLNEIDQLIIYNNDESGWMNILTLKPISNNMDLFYYEVKVGMSNPSKKCLYSWSIGFSTSKVQLHRYPDRLYSWDYYNTGSINKNNSLEKYGDTFTQNDVIGCGIDFKNNLAFFTKNGKFLGVAVNNFLTEDLELYPNIGLFNYAKVETNFGAKEFVFNIKSYFYNKIH